MDRLTKYSKKTTHENGICCTHFLGPECIGSVLGRHSGIADIIASGIDAILAADVAPVVHGHFAHAGPRLRRRRADR